MGSSERGKPDPHKCAAAVLGVSRSGADYSAGLRDHAQCSRAFCHLVIKRFKAHCLKRACPTQPGCAGNENCSLPNPPPPQQLHGGRNTNPGGQTGTGERASSRLLLHEQLPARARRHTKHRAVLGQALGTGCEELEEGAATPLPVHPLCFLPAATQKFAVLEDKSSPLCSAALGGLDSHLITL